MSNTNQNEAAPQAEQASSLQMVSSMGGIGFAAGILIVLTFQFTLPIITINKARVLEQSIFQVLPGATQKTAYVLDASGEFVHPEGEGEKLFKYYAGYNANGELVGVAMEAAGQGFQETLKLLYGYSPDKECIIGIKVLESKETPGLGDKIEKDPIFLKNFVALDVSLADDRQTMRNPILLVKPGEKTEEWQIDAITGATISSRAVANILRISSAKHAPIIIKNLELLKSN
ncbi:MAG: hypothetical protein B6244_09590 [Candidatus Cloacimonetes bacterium 4572_55]|nr:MAG: hypothetical protein B6244_09590 [Candidatus Cloacimonetes bacterium 4572_55]